MGAVILSALIEAMGTDACTFSPYGIREGALIAASGGPLPLAAGVEFHDPDTLAPSSRNQLELALA
jgi:hypothetical protein